MLKESKGKDYERDEIRAEVSELAEKLDWANVCREWDGDLREEELKMCINDGGWKWNYSLSDNSLLIVMNKMNLEMNEDEKLRFVWNGRNRSTKMRRLMLGWAYKNDTMKLEKELKEMIYFGLRGEDIRRAKWFIKECEKGRR